MMNRLIFLLVWMSGVCAAGTPMLLRAPTTGDGAAGDFFGVRLYSDADWLMVGSYGDVINSLEVFSGLKSGSVKIYRRNGGQLLPTQTLLPPAPTPSTLFGDEIQRVGNRIAVSAPRFSSGTGGQEGGGVFLFTLIDNLWVHERTLVPPSAAAFGRFGESILLRDDELWVGAPQRGVGGQVFRFDLLGGSSNPVATLNGPTAGARLGETMAAVDALQFAIGAPGASQVLLYPFTGPLIALDTLNGPPSFGTTLLAGENALVVAARDDGPGRVLRWIRDSKGWQAQAELSAVNGESGDQFGASLLIVGNSLLIGAPGTNRGADFDVGAVYQAPLSGPAVLDARTVPAAPLSTLFGTALAFDAGTSQVLVGAPLLAVDNQRSGSVLGYAVGELGSAAATPLSSLTRGAGSQLFRFAQSVAIDGNQVLAGAFLAETSAGPDSGAAYGFSFDGAQWSFDQQIVPPDGMSDQRFGLALDISGEHAVAGAYWDVIGSNAEQGSAYFYRLINKVWVQQLKVVASNGSERDNFGAAVAIDGDLAAVGARGANLTLVDQGAVNIYRYNGSAWTSAGQLLAAEPAGSQFFGQAVAVCGQRVVVGAPGADGNVESEDSGLAYVFDLPLNGDPILRATLAPNETTESRNFGFAVACSGELVAIGAPGGGAVPFGGELEVFRCQATGCALERVLQAADAEPGDQLGVSVALHGRRLLGGISGRDADGLFDVGAALMFERDSLGSWGVLETIAAPHPVALGGFGRSLDMDAQRMVIGSPTAAGDNPSEGKLEIRNQPESLLLLQDGFE